MKIWIGLVEPRIDLVEDVERLLRAQGHDVTWRSYPSLPVGDALARLVAMIAPKHDVFGWLCEETGPSAAEMQAAISAHSPQHLFFQVRDGRIELLGAETPLGPAKSSPDTAFHMARAFHGKAP